MLPHLDAAYGLACWLLRDAHEAEDAVQDAYLKGYEAWPQYRGGSSAAWLLKIVRNTCLSEAARGLTLKPICIEPPRPLRRRCRHGRCRQDAGTSPGAHTSRDDPSPKAPSAHAGADIGIGQVRMLRGALAFGLVVDLHDLVAAGPIVELDPVDGEAVDVARALIGESAANHKNEGGWGHGGFRQEGASAL
jgi:Sigma-70 region 2